MGGLRHEAMLEVLFDAAGNLCGCLARSDGNAGTVSARYRPLFEQAFRTGAAGFMIVHNHPSGDPQPSRRDIIATRSIATMARVMEFEFLDHVIIGGRSAVSMRQAGLIP